ncbi:MAG TPA: SUMF1/EgtB/PvdO family nonheme iron enzyme [Actinocrinis sp.]|jgi:formylglycine-generating enzyme required for sulfatase activity
MDDHPEAVDWVEVPAGELVRGTPADTLDAVHATYADIGVPLGWLAKECPRSVVPVPGFRISRVPVTIGLWNRFAGSTGAAVLAGPADYPVDGVPWPLAVALCRWLTDETGQHVDLPTELQWERAARGDDAREFPWGDTYDRRCANTRELGLNTYLPVGTLLRGASPFGVLDLGGNVDEWLRDEYFRYPGAPDAVPESEDWALDRHMTRGGAFHHARDLARCARRHGVYEGSATGRGAGIRLVVDD